MVQSLAQLQRGRIEEQPEEYSTLSEHGVQQGTLGKSLDLEQVAPCYKSRLTRHGAPIVCLPIYVSVFVLITRHQLHLQFRHQHLEGAQEFTC